MTFPKDSNDAFSDNNATLPNSYLPPLLRASGEYNSHHRSPLLRSVGRMKGEKIDTVDTGR